MKYVFLILGLVVTTNTHAINLDSLYQDDVSSIEKICEAMLAAFSGKKEEQKDWNRFENLFLPSAQQINTSMKNKIGVASMEEFMENEKPWYDANDFSEWTVKYTIRKFGNIASVFQVWDCEWNNPEDNDSGSSRGLTGFQLAFNEGRWWIVNLIWDGETEEKIIDTKYTE